MVVTTGSQQAIALVADALIRPGERVVVESPTWPGALKAFASWGARLLEMPVDREGMCMEGLENLLLSESPRLTYTVPTFHNPTGAVMSGFRRRYLVSLARRLGIPILEDDALREVRFGAPLPPPLAALDRSGNVINIGSFTKALLPAARVGYLSGPPELCEAVVSHKRWLDMFTSPLMQHALGAYLESGEAVRYWKCINRVYAQRQRAMLDALARYFPPSASWQHKVGGGPQMWVRLPGGLPVSWLQQQALQARISFVPGEAFFPKPQGQPFIRLNFAAVDEDRKKQGIETLGRLIRAGLAELGMALTGT